MLCHATRHRLCHATRHMLCHDTCHTLCHATHPTPMRLMAVCLAVGRGGLNRMDPLFSTPSGTLTSTARAARVCTGPPLQAMATLAEVEEVVTADTTHSRRMSSPAARKAGSWEYPPTWPPTHTRVGVWVWGGCGVCVWGVCGVCV